MLKNQFNFDERHPCFPGHFPGHPMVPGALLLAQITDWLRQEGIASQHLADAKFLQNVHPNDAVDVEYDPHTQKIQAFVGTACVLRGTLL